jgi:serine/threonine-protein kinase
VANVVEQQEAQARATLEAQGLEVEVERRPNDSVARGIVVNQDPPGGTSIEEGDTVLLTVSDGVGTTEIPDVSGDSAEEAQSRLQEARLNPVLRPEASNEVEPGIVIRTNPEAGERVDRNSDVEVIVSSGPAPVEVPNVEGQDQVDATQTLSQAGFRVSKSNEASDSVPSGSVIGTNPPAGTPAQRGSVVTIIVSSGPDETEVPDVVDESQSQATETLTDAGFDVQVVQVPSSPQSQGRVIDQNPEGGGRASRGSAVVITVGAGPGNGNGNGD